MKIERLSKKIRNIVIYFDNSEKIKINYEVFLRSGYHAGSSLSDKQLETLLDENHLFQTKESAFRLLTRRMYAEHELKTKLLSREYRPEFIEIAVSELRQKGYINDEDFAVAFCRDRIKFRKYGINKIRSELMKRKINRSIIDKVLSEHDDENQFYENALYFANKKLVVLKRKEYSDYQLKTKVYSHLINKGFHQEVISEVIKKLNL